MLIFRSILAVILGFLAMVVAVVAGTILIVMATGVAAGKPTPLYLALNVALSPIAALPGGWVARRLAPVNPERFVGVLAFLVLALGWVTAIRGGAPGQPVWYVWVAPLLGALGVLAGGRAWKRA